MPPKLLFPSLFSSNSTISPASNTKLSYSSIPPTSHLNKPHPYPVTADQIVRTAASQTPPSAQSASPSPNQGSSSTTTLVISDATKPVPSTHTPTASPISALIAFSGAVFVRTPNPASLVMPTTLEPLTELVSLFVDCLST